jgi:acyl-CoA thioesterase
VLAVAGHALSQALPQHPDPFSVTAHYLRPAQTGPATITVDVARSGRKHSTASASMVQEGRERIRVLATYGNLATQDGPTKIDAAPPDVAPIEQCISRGSLSVDGSTIGERIEAMLNPGIGWTTGTPGGTATLTGWIGFKDKRPADPLSLLFFADAFPPALFDSLPEKVWLPTIELTVHVRAIPAPGPLRGIMRTRFLINGYLEEDGELWDSTDRLVAQSRQLGMLFRP